MSCYFLGGLVVDMIGVVSSSQQRSMYTPTRVKGSAIAMRSSASIVFPWSVGLSCYTWIGAGFSGSFVHPVSWTARLVPLVGDFHCCLLCGFIILFFWCCCTFVILVICLLVSLDRIYW